ncbi:MAG TPA: EVE domain-containing protein [Dehalococcoidia bacterium]|nr:EVE domain-containing protein [Dehalococcoidia bacterium]
MADQPGYYIVVTSPENWAKTAARDWTLLGLKSTKRGLAGKFKPGDRVVAYYTGLKRFGAVLKVTSDCFEDHERIWLSPDKPREDYPYRVRTEPEIVLPPGELLDAKELALRMSWTQKWPAEHWTLAFQGNIHAIPAADFELIRGEMTQAVSAG